MTYKITIPEDRGIKYEAFKYPAGETQVRLKPEQIPVLSNAKEILVTAHLNGLETGFIELALLTSAIQGVIENNHDYTQMCLNLPYLPYARADRRFLPGDCFGLETYANLINTLDYDVVYSSDVHSKIAGELINRFQNLDVYDSIAQVITTINDENLILLLPDEGAKRYNLEQFGLPVFQAGKIRNPTTGNLSGFKIPIKEIGAKALEAKKAIRSILIVDDICDGGGTFIGLAEEIKKHYPWVKLYLYVTHGIFSQGIKPLFKHFKQVYFTTTFKSPYIKEKKKWNLIQSFTSIFTR